MENAVPAFVLQIPRQGPRGGWSQMCDIRINHMCKRNGPHLSVVEMFPVLSAEFMVRKDVSVTEMIRAASS